MSQVAYVGLVGKVFDATTGKIDGNSYADMSSITGKKIFVNTALVEGGRPGPHNTTWDSPAMLDTMWNAGVVGLIQSNESSAHYEDVISQYRGGGGNQGGNQGGDQGGNQGGEPPKPGPTDSAGFSFSVASSVNSWWIQVQVEAPSGGLVEKVSAEVNGNVFWLDYQPWGAWATSPSSPVPAGARVNFTAYDDQQRTGTFASEPWPGG